MPSEENTDERRLAGTRSTDDRDVLPRFDREAHVVQDLAPGHPNVDALEGDGDTGRYLARLTAGRTSPVSAGQSRWERPAVREAAPARCAAPGIAGSGAASSRPEPGEAHRPVDEEQCASRAPASLDVAKHEPRRQAEAGERLQAVDDETTSKQVQAGPRPLGDQRLVPAADRTLRAVGPSGDQTEKAVQIEPAHGRSVRPLSELALGEHALGDERNAECESGRDSHDRSAGRIDPGQADRCEDELHRGPNQPGAESGSARNVGRPCARCTMSDTSRL